MPFPSDEKHLNRFGWPHRQNPIGLHRQLARWIRHNGVFLQIHILSLCLEQHIPRHDQANTGDAKQSLIALKRRAKKTKKPYKKTDLSERNFRKIKQKT
jgi:hypothetical protein